MPTHTRVLLVDAAGPDGSPLQQLLAAAGHETMHAWSVDDALTNLGSAGAAADVVLVDLAVAGLPGVTRLAGASPAARVIVLAGDTSTAGAREALRLGAFDLVSDRDDADMVLFSVERAVHAGQLLREVAALRARVGERVAQALVGRSSAIARVRELIGRAAATRMTVLVTGEAGTGKDLVARLVHDLSERADRPFVTVRCAGVPAEALEAELFGAVNADGTRTRVGLLEEARGGTLVLDEFPALPPVLRAKMAQLLAERAIRPTGDLQGASIPVDVRLVLTARDAAAAAPLARGDGAGDSMGRVNVLPIALPPLRERRSDVPLLMQHFRVRAMEEMGVELPPVSPDTMLGLLGQSWPGNVRELEHFVERMAYQTPPAAPVAAPERESEAPFATTHSLDAVERQHILRVLEQESGNQSRAADRLGIDRRTLYRKLRQYREDGDPVRAAG